MEKDIRKVSIKTDYEGARALSLLADFVTELKLTETGQDNKGGCEIELSFDILDIACKYGHNSRGAGRKRNSVADADLIRELMQEGKTLDDIAAELGTSKRTLYRRLKEQ